jgi:hypothetical protein
MSDVISSDCRQKVGVVALRFLPWLLLASAVVCLSAWPCWVVWGLPVAESQAAQVREGMTREQVRFLVEQPAPVVAYPDGSESWIYQRGTLTVFIVRFSPQGAVTSSGFKW